MPVTEADLQALRRELFEAVSALRMEFQREREDRIRREAGRESIISMFKWIAPNLMALIVIIAALTAFARTP